MPIGNHYACCEICGGLGHKTKSCALRDLEARKDPFGEEIRKLAHRQRSGLRSAVTARRQATPAQRLA